MARPSESRAIGMGTVREQAARLDASRIVDAALTIAARDGAPAVTMRRLGAELGVDATAFYRHFRTKDDLLAAMAERLLRPRGGAVRARSRLAREPAPAVLGGVARLPRAPGLRRDARAAARRCAGAGADRRADPGGAAPRGAVAPRRRALLPLVGRSGRGLRAVPGDRAAARGRTRAGPRCGEGSRACRPPRIRRCTTCGRSSTRRSRTCSRTPSSSCSTPSRIRSAQSGQRHEEER